MLTAHFVQLDRWLAPGDLQAVRWMCRAARDAWPPCPMEATASKDRLRWAHADAGFRVTHLAAAHVAARGDLPLLGLAFTMREDSDLFYDHAWDAAKPPAMAQLPPLLIKNFKPSGS